MSDRIPPRPVTINVVSQSCTTKVPAVPPVPVRRHSLDKICDLKAPLLSSLSDIQRSSHKETMFDDTNSSFTFEAKNHWQDAFKTLFDFYQKKQLCDIEVRVGFKSVKCHRLVLACVSRYFKTMFLSDMAEARKPVIMIKDIDENALEILVKFAYTSKVTITTDNVQALLYASSILQIEIVANACCEFMKSHLHPNNCIGVRTFAEQHGRNDLMKIADQYTYDNFREVVDSEEFVTMSLKHMEALVSSDDLNVDAELQVYEAVMKWVKSDLLNRKRHLASLISKVKLPLLPTAYLMEKVETEDLLKKDLECRDYLDEAKYYQLSIASVIPIVKMSERMRPRKSCAGVVFCVGGRGASGDPFKSTECYDLRRDRWFQVAEMSVRRRHVGVVAVSGKLYAAGGHDGSEHLNSSEVFEPVTNRWRPIAPMATLRRGIALCCLGGPIYAVGGLDDTSCYNIVERYDPESDTWSFVQAMIMPRGGVAVAALKGYMYAVGGNDGATSLDSCERYDPHLNKWTMVASMNKRRAGAGVAELDGFLYVAGGFDDNSPLDSVERYDPKTNTWTEVGKMTCCRGGVGVTALAGKLIAVGGHDGSNYLNSVEAYDTITNSWSPLQGVAMCRAGAGVAFCNVTVGQMKDQKASRTSSCV